MTVIIIVATIILYLILLVFTWHNLDMLEGQAKIMYIAAGTVAMFIITLIVFNISTNGVQYENENMISSVRNILIAIFMPLNGLIVMPYIAYLLNKIKQEDITEEKFKKRMILIIVIFIVFLIFECNYLKSIQEGILGVFNSL